MRGKHEFIRKQTVLYRENPNSESHTQGETVRIYSATLGLIRVFGSNEFVDFLSGVAKDARETFVSKLENAINRRISNQEYAQLLWSICLEQMTHAWAYEDSKTTAATSELFSKLGQSYTPGILNGILRKLDSSVKTNNDNLTNHIDTELDLLETNKAQRRTILSVLYQVVGRLPYFMRRRIFKLYNSITSKSKSKPKGTL
jgi:hypothetical protein